MQRLLLTLLVITWLGGGNILLIQHYRRLGKPWWWIFNPLGHRFDFNAREWLALFGLLTLSMVLGIAAMLTG